MTSEINLAAEIASGDVVPLIKVARRYAVNPSTVFRWVTKGLPSGCGIRVRLEAIKRGKCWITSEAAMRRFFAALPASVPNPVSQPVRSSKKRDQDCANAKKRLAEKYGI